MGRRLQLGRENECGEIARGYRADFCLVETPAKCREPLQAIFNEDTRVKGVFIAGKPYLITV